MKNYPLFPHDKKQWIYWRKTYLEELNRSICALWDYSNYFLPDYFEYTNQDIYVDGNTTKIEITKLPYNAFFRATEETSLYIHNVEVPNHKLGAGYLLLSKAKNEGQTDLKALIDNYFIQPFGYASFYLWTYKNGQLVADYDENAEEKYGLNYEFSLFNTYPRFIYQGNEGNSGRLWVFSSYNNSNDAQITTSNGAIWTDPNTLKPMLFWKKGSEEIIIDSQEYTSIRVATKNICEYNTLVLEKETENIWPEDITPLMI